MKQPSARQVFTGEALIHGVMWTRTSPTHSWSAQATSGTEATVLNRLKADSVFWRERPSLGSGVYATTHPKTLAADSAHTNGQSPYAADKRARQLTAAHDSTAHV
ncbi:hypothetical protein JD292_07170 [Leucobacter sp. CSA2]|uniref:Uncharacterized protein n=1 Tax=Leucobacter edaphi TaxID=2796472 RepID=A0A934QET0_9MICO|nr:hypothetical protein [Leucobacter edaphi]MBK0421852.1 hypothetical protein [Leucobacter edaphi]